MTPTQGTPSLRVDPLRGWATIVAPARAHRPVDAALRVRDGDRSAEREVDDSECPFCPGAESALGEILQELPAVVEGDPWGARAVRNLHPFTAAPAAGGDVHLDGPVHGHHEVLIETPRHRCDPSDMTPTRLRTVVDLWIARTAAAHAEAPRAEVHLFRNRGRDAGSSRSHPHGQLVRMHTPTPGRTGLIGRLRESLRRDGCCAICASERSEPMAAERTVLETDHFVVRTLWAPLDPGHLRVIPRRHAPSPAGAGPEERNDLADVLRRTLVAVRDAFGDPDWNLLVHDAGPSPDPALHWHVELRPRTARGAGFEQSAQMGVCGSDPLHDAAQVRHALQHSEARESHQIDASSPEDPGVSPDSFPDPGHR